MKIAIIAMTILILLAACSAKSDAPAESLVASPADSTQAADSLKAPTPLVTFIELGAATCIPCKMMQPIMKEIKNEYQGLVNVVFYDLNKDRQAGQKYGVRVMPTQVFLDAEGKEFFRHEGFYPKAEIQKMLEERAGILKPVPD